MRKEYAPDGAALFFFFYIEAHRYTTCYAIQPFSPPATRAVA